ncbi:MAG: cation:proton antiporter, partial [Methylobacter sp.]
GLAALLGLSYFLLGLLARLRIPGILAALLVAILIKNTPLGAYLLHPEFNQTFSFLAELGVLFLLFFVGLQIDVAEMFVLGRDIVALTLSKIVLTGLLVTSVMLGLGYSWLLAVVVGMIRIPTAEAVIIPILDEFRLIRTRVGEIIIGTSILDDIIEILMVTFVSIWINGSVTAFNTAYLSDLAVKSAAFVLLVLVMFFGIMEFLCRWCPRRTSNLILLAMVILFGFAGISEWSGLGMVMGALSAGVVTRPSFDRAGDIGEQARQVIRSISYGFLAPVFFFWVGLHMDLQGLIEAPTLTLLLIASAFLAKLTSVLLMVPLHRINLREGLIIGVSINAGLTTEIIVAQLMLDAQLIDVRLFTALVAASSVSTIGVPLVLTMLIRHWQDHISTRREA